MKFFFLPLTVALMICSGECFSQNREIRDSIHQYYRTKPGILNPGDKAIFISIKNQKLYLTKGDSILKTYPVSSSKYGTGSKAGSNQTPTGMHVVKEKFGKGLSTGAILEARKPTGKIATIIHEAVDDSMDYVTSRILWLDGLEPGKNKGGKVDSYKRYIYIHGTHEEGLIGKPASHGCIRMLNKDVMELYDLVKPGTVVVILDDSLQ